VDTYTATGVLESATNALQEIMQDSVQVEHIVIYFNRGMLLIGEKPFTEQDYEHLKEHLDKNEVIVQVDSQTILIKEQD